MKIFGFRKEIILKGKHNILIEFPEKCYLKNIR